VIGANVQGATMLSETLAQYSALMVMKQRYGDAKMKRFLRYELDRYLRGRAVESKREVPLAKVEDQAYIHYAKGSLVMYALQDYLGEAKVNAAIKEFRDANAYHGPPYPTTLTFVDTMRRAAPPELAYLVDDLFDRIVLFENRALSATARKLDDKRYEVTLEVRAKKLRADDLGAETEVNLDDRIEIGVMSDDTTLYLAKHRLKAGDNELKLVVEGRPTRAGIDPLNKLIDRTPADNTTSVELD
jgi:aminopeptidase N